MQVRVSSWLNPSRTEGCRKTTLQPWLLWRPHHPGLGMRTCGEKILQTGGTEVERGATSHSRAPRARAWPSTHGGADAVNTGADRLFLLDLEMADLARVRHVRSAAQLLRHAAKRVHRHLLATSNTRMAPVFFASSYGITSAIEAAERLSPAVIFTRRRSILGPRCRSMGHGCHPQVERQR